MRFKSSKSSKSKRYANTLNLPQTSFPLSMKNGAAASREKAIQKTDQFAGLYLWQRKQPWDKQFVLHDGPPYANGKTHVGHAVNKILKDITNRYKVMKKFKVHYVPGWDCHGMPIELKAITDKKGGLEKLSTNQIREKARKYAQGQVRDQKKSFKSWGVMADWNKPYLTLSKEYQIKQLEIFYKIYQKGLVYRDYMPVFWSPSSRTALAEAELEYNPDHVSRAVYLAMPLVTCPHIDQLVEQMGAREAKIYAVIWTTTPWTLPFNRFICFNTDICYAYFKCQETSSVYLCEEAFGEKLAATTGKDFEKLATIKGQDLADMRSDPGQADPTYRHPLTDELLPLVPGRHVVAGLGTGLVHTAPAHGHDDFKVATDHNQTVTCHVDEDGVYTSGVPDCLIGKQVGKDANEAVIDMLQEWVLRQEDFTHSYPYDWRTKQPIIIRASQQWFVDVAALRQEALTQLSTVKITPQQSEAGMVSQLQGRPYWCISRQRTWGVPIPVFYHRQTGEPLITRETVGHVTEVFKRESPDSWWDLTVAQLLPDELLAKLNKGKSCDYVKGSDILDIWFDSGVSWASVLQDSNGQADVYLEGIDQFKGWFQTSLLTSVAAQGRAPYKQIITHGFATDEEGKKMSKSIGNVTDPYEVINGGKDKKTKPSYGVDVLRWWVAHSHHHPHIQVGPTILSGFHEDVFKLRKCLRYLMGNLSDFRPSVDCVSYDEMTAVDRYMLYVLHTFMTQVETAYDNISYNKVIQNLEKFVYSDLSSFYINITRDRCYCSGVDTLMRRSSQTVQHHILHSLTAAFAPILPHLAEEIFSYMLDSELADKTVDSVFKQGWVTPLAEWADSAAVDQLMPVFDMRRHVMEEIGLENPLEFDALIYCSPQLAKLLKTLQPEPVSTTSSLCEVLQTSQVSLLDHAPSTIPEDTVLLQGSTRMYGGDGEEVDYKILVMTAALHLCERCRRYTATSTRQPCDRCMSAMADDWAS